MGIKRLAFSFIGSVIILCGAASAQEAGGAKGQPASGEVVTAAASASGVRFVAPGQVRRVRLEVYTQAGERLYDSDFRAGGVAEWEAAGVADGSYLCVVTVEDLEGRGGRRLSAVSVAQGRAAVRADGEAKLKAEFAQALAAAGHGEDLAMAARQSGGEQAVTVVAHDGRDGRVSSASGALTLRTGNAFDGTDKEQMRVTPEGRVGIGTDSPEDALDVAGTIRARGGIRFADGTVLTSANGSSGMGVTTGGGATTNASGTGTANKLAKWFDASGTLGDSVITESGGNVGIGTASPSTPLDVAYDDNGFGFGINIRNTNTGAQALTGYGINNAAGGRVGQFVYVPPAYTVPALRDTLLFSSAGPTAALGFVSSADGSGTPDIFFRAGGTNPDAIRIKGTTGNVGIGTAAPTAKLEVAGNIKASGAGNGIIFPDGTKQTSAAGGVGNSNTWTATQIFSAGLSAGGTQLTNVGNPVSAGDATNKAYVDANFVKFVPGTEQLSVGDANGTAPMINLRGGSTCCSGPGGHTPAFFKVFQNGSFVATGNLGIGTSPMEGKGYRTSWHTYKGAFRSGYADNEWDDANVGFFSWAGGSNSTASGLYALAFGDTNYARSTSSIAFGSGNEVKGAAGFSAGAGNRVCDTYGVALGNNAKSGGPYIDGKCDPETFNIRGLAAVAIGYNVTADQDHTMALGKFASNNGWQGTFIWSDGAPQASADTFRNTANNEFAARATGGFRFRTNLGGTTGCNLPAGSGVFNCTSSRTTKENFLSVDGNDVLAKLRKVPVSTWNYISEGQQSRHLGPMAEDFHAAFGLGASDKAIGVQDAVGVSLAAVKALDARTLELQQKTEEVEQLRSKVNSLEERLAALEQLIQKQAGGRQK